MYFFNIVFAAYAVLYVGGPLESENGSCFELRAQPYRGVEIERLPLLINVTLTNKCNSPISTWYYSGTEDLMERWAIVVVKDARGRVYRLNYVGGPTVRVPLPVPMPLSEGDKVSADFVRSLIYRGPTPARWAGPSTVLLKFLGPGSYVSHLELPHIGGETLVSNSFEFEIAATQREVRSARDGIAPANVGFLEGRDRTMRPAIQKILDDFPDSEYAEWIRFWKVYHHGSEAEALAYARAHQDFPLCDNLMFRVAQHVANDDARHNEALALLAELQRIFPGGDTVYQAKTFQEKLVNKKRRP